MWSKWLGTGNSATKMGAIEYLSRSAPPLISFLSPKLITCILITLPLNCQLWDTTKHHLKKDRLPIPTADQSALVINTQPQSFNICKKIISKIL